MSDVHIVRAYDDQLGRLNKMIVDMGVLASSQVASATQALVRRDPRLAEEVIAADARIDQLEGEIEELVVKMLALRQPMANDLRNIVCALKIASDLERIADYAKNNAKRGIALAQMMPTAGSRGLPGVSRMVEGMIHDVLSAFADRDDAKAISVWQRDSEVDDAYTSLLRENLTYMMEDPRNITACTHLLFIAKNLERMGDHATNIAENVHYVVSGKRLGENRPRGTDEGSIVTPDAAGSGNRLPDIEGADRA